MLCTLFCLLQVTPFPISEKVSQYGSQHAFPFHLLSHRNSCKMMKSVVLLYVCISCIQALLYPRVKYHSSFSQANTLYMSDRAKLCGLSINVPDRDGYSGFYAKHMQLPYNSDKHTLQIIPNAHMYVQAWEKDAVNDEFEVGDGFYGIGLATPLAQFLAENAAAEGVTFRREFDAYSYGAASFPDEDEMKQYPVSFGLAKDPLGLFVEMKEDLKVPINTYCKIILKVIDLEKSMDFYSNVVGLKLFRKRSNINNRPREASTSAFLGDKTEKEGVVLELLYKFATETLDLGNAFQELIFEYPKPAMEFEKHLKDLKKDFDMLQGGDIVLKDPNGYKLRFTFPSKEE